MSSTAHPASRILEIVAGPYAEAVSQVWTGSRIAEYLAAPDLRRHVWHACLASPYGNFSTAREDLALLYERMQTMKSKDLLVQAYGVRPAGLLGTLKRLGPQPREPEIYQMLISVLEKEGRAAKFLMHLEHPTDAWIETLASLPDAIGTSAFEALTRCCTIAPEDLALVSWTIARLEQTHASHDLSQILRANKPVEALMDILMRQPFPSPPWQGTLRLQPIASSMRFFELAIRYRNCLQRPNGSKEVLKVLSGIQYFYEWRGQEPAVIDLVRLPGVGWYVNNAIGPGNHLLSFHGRAEIAHDFSAASIICASRLTVRANVYPCGKFWGDLLRGVQ
jgi:hypothetical protein